MSDEVLERESRFVPLCFERTNSSFLFSCQEINVQCLHVYIHPRASVFARSLGVILTFADVTFGGQMIQ